MKHEWRSSLQGEHPSTPRGREPQGPLRVVHCPSVGLTFTGCQTFLVLLGTGVGGVAERPPPPHPLGSTHHSGSNCMSLGSSAGCTGSGLLKRCCGHIDSLHAGGRGRHCGASSGGSGGAPYCSGPLS